MAVTVKVGNQEEIEAEGENKEGAIKIKVGPSDEPKDIVVKVLGDKEEGHKPVSIKLNVRKSLDGNIIISDHPDIDIVIMPPQSKIVAFPKEKRTDKVYDVQDRFFNFLNKKGIVNKSKIQSGAAFGSMEAMYPVVDQEKFSAVQVILLTISKFIDEESEYFNIDDEFEKEFEDSLTDPDEEESTELGEVPHADQKGSIRPGYIYSPYGISSIYRYE